MTKQRPVKSRGWRTGLVNQVAAKDELIPVGQTTPCAQWVVSERRRFSIGMAVVLFGVMSPAVLAQTPLKVHCVSARTSFNNTCPDSLALSKVKRDTGADVLAEQKSWHFLRSVGRTEARQSTLLRRRPVDATPSVPANLSVGRTRTVRGVAQLGSHFFSASNSFEAVVGSKVGLIYGGGLHVVLGKMFVQGSIERYNETGQRVFVFEEQVFELGIANEVSVIPIHVSLGYREEVTSSIFGYLGGGFSWYTYSEESEFASPTENTNEQEVGYHVVGGVETPVFPWLWWGGEFQWAYVPNILGTQGVSAVFGEGDLGGITVRLKLSFGY